MSGQSTNARPAPVDLRWSSPRRKPLYWSFSVARVRSNPPLAGTLEAGCVCTGDPFTLPGVHNRRQPTDNGSMATYGYRCVEDGDFDIRRALGTAPTRSVCPVCNNEAARVFRPPMLSLAPRALLTAIDRTEKSGDEPDVVSTVPPRRVTGQGLPAPQNAAWQRLPRP